MSKIEELAKKWITDAIVLAALTAAGYTIAYAFEMGYADHFGYPHYVISPTPGTIASALIFLFFLGSFGLQAVSYAVLHENPIVRVRLLHTLLIFAMMAVVAVISRWESVSYAAVVVGVGTVGFMWWQYFRTVRSQRQRSPFADGRTIGSIGLGGGINSSRAREALADSVRQFPKRPRWQLSFLGFAALLSILWLAVLGGQFYARSQNTFYVMKAKPEFAVVRMYGDLVIASRIDLKSGLFTGEYLIAKVGDSDAKLDLAVVSTQTTRPLVRLPRP